jgi:hypothetical protein
MNYINHGIKKLTATPLVAKRATGVAVALLNIFTEQGPPSILQADNGGEFSSSATDHVGSQMLFDNEFIDVVISKIKQFGQNVNLCGDLQGIQSLMEGSSDSTRPFRRS